MLNIYNLNFSYSIYSVLRIIRRNRKYESLHSIRARSTWTKTSTHALAGCGPSGPLISRDSTLVRAQRSGKGVKPGNLGTYGKRGAIHFLPCLRSTPYYNIHGCIIICSDCATWGNLGMYMYPVIHTLHSVLNNNNKKKLTLQFVLRTPYSVLRSSLIISNKSPPHRNPEHWVRGCDIGANQVGYHVLTNTGCALAAPWPW